MEEHNSDHWLAKTETIRILWIVLFVVLILLVGAEFFVKRKPYFEIDSTFAFSIWYAVASCVGMVIVAKVLGIILKRWDTYYND